MPEDQGVSLSITEIQIVAVCGSVAVSLSYSTILAPTFNNNSSCCQVSPCRAESRIASIPKHRSPQTYPLQCASLNIFHLRVGVINTGGYRWYNAGVIRCAYFRRPSLWLALYTGYQMLARSVVPPDPLNSAKIVIFEVTRHLY